MLMAETSGKLAVVQTDAAPTDISRMEDVLTSNVWGVLKNCEHSVVQSLLASAHPPIPEVSGEHLDFRFWQRFDDRTEPDVIISAGKDVIIVEVKYHSDFDTGSDERAPQILREIAGARRAYPGTRIHFLGVTREERIAWPSKVCARGDYVETLRMYLDEGLLHELSWSAIYEWLTRMVAAPDGNLSPVSMRFLKDLHEYLQYKEIGYVPACITGRDRPFVHLFPQSEPVVALPDRLGFDIGLNAVVVPGPSRLVRGANPGDRVEAVQGLLRKASVSFADQFENSVAVFNSSASSRLTTWPP